LVIETSARAVAVMVYVEVLFARFESRVSEATVAVFATVPAELGPLTTSVIAAEPRAAIMPREQLTVLVPEQVPVDGVAETNVVPAGRMSPAITFTAGLGPKFVTVMAYVMFAFAATVAGVGPILVIETSAWAAATTMLHVLFVPVFDAESRTLVLKEEVPAVVGVPVTAPVEGVMAKPSGSVPPVIENVV
jgi:hypothetical protein